MAVPLLLLFVVVAAVAAFLLGRSQGSGAHQLDTERRFNEETQRATRADTQAAALTAERDRLQGEVPALRTALAAAQHDTAGAAAALAASEAQVRGRGEQLDEIRGRLHASEARAQTLETELRQAVTALEGLRRQAETESREAEKRLQSLAEAETRLTNQFKVLADQIFHEKSARFKEESEASLGGLLNPLRERMGEFQQKVEALQQDGVVGRTELREQLGNLRELNQQLSNEAGNLVRALKGSSKVQGDWGEMLLERMLQSAGLRAGHEYRVQPSMTTEDGRQTRPDVILDLPGEKHLVVDSKVSLNAYSDYCACQDDSPRNGHLERHARALRTHVDGLSRRTYQAVHGLRSLDFVVMFVPIEPAYLLAVAHDEGLWQHAWDRDVLLVSPGTLFPVLRTVAHIWRQERQTRNVERIAQEAGRLYDKVAIFAETFLEVGRRMDAAKTSYDKAFNQLKHGKGDVMGRIENMRTLGAATTKKMPAIFASAADENEAEDAGVEVAAQLPESPTEP